MILRNAALNRTYVNQKKIIIEHANTHTAFDGGLLSARRMFPDGRGTGLSNRNPSRDQGWAGHYYYPLEEDRSVEFCAYHPYAAAGSDGDCFVEAPAPGKAPALHFTLSGQEDVMCAEPVIGSRSRVPGPLEFRHVLTQLRLRLVDPEGAFAGETLDEIALLDVNTTGVMDVETGALGAWGDPAELAVPGIETVPITGSEELPQEVGGEVMLQPGLSSFVIRVVTSRGSYDRVVIRPTSVIGTFRPLTGISLSATVVPWQMGGTGSGVVQ